ncbi:hypothetical protein WR25_05089 [Diploscapter pachys]|uniref:Uncharacterized protein n=1 Tax=Diploscapter pachys TaxID=2018661 RepID=A0A2A2K7P7_9BILA|nr:hypothetical protein WR25_05089 [Diploscapter pachys]
MATVPRPCRPKAWYWAPASASCWYWAWPALLVSATAANTVSGWPALAPASPCWYSPTTCRAAWHAVTRKPSWTWAATC